MTEMTKSERALIIAYLDARTDYDAATVRIHRAGIRAGTVSAIKDANKTYNGPETIRIYIGHVENVLADAVDWKRDIHGGGWR